MVLEKTFAMLADPTRKEILHRLVHVPLREQPTAHLPAHLASDPCGIDPFAQRGRERIYELALSGGKTMRKALNQLREMARHWNTILAAFKRYAEGKMKQSKVEPNPNGAPARKEPER